MRRMPGNIGFLIALISLFACGAVRALTIPEFRQALKRHAKATDIGFRSKDAQLQFALGLNGIFDSNPKLQDADTNFDSETITEETPSIRFHKNWSKSSALTFEYEGHFRQYSTSTGLNHNEHLAQMGLEFNFSKARRKFAIVEKFARLTDTLDVLQDEVAERNINELNPYFTSDLGRNWKMKFGGYWRTLSYIDSDYSGLDYSQLIGYLHLGRVMGKDIQAYGRYEYGNLTYTGSQPFLNDFMTHSVYAGLHSEYLRSLKYDLRIGFASLTADDKIAIDPSDSDTAGDVCARFKLDWTVLEPNSVISFIASRQFAPSTTSNYGVFNSAEARWTHTFDKNSTYMLRVSTKYSQIVRSVSGQDMSLLNGRVGFNWWFMQSHVNGSVYIAAEINQRTSDVKTQEYDQTRGVLGLVLSY